MRNSHVKLVWGVHQECRICQLCRNYLAGVVRKPARPHAKKNEDKKPKVEGGNPLYARHTFCPYTTTGDTVNAGVAFTWHHRSNERLRRQFTGAATVKPG